MNEHVIALYMRLSMEDIRTDSYSISNQRLYLMDYVANMPEYGQAEIREFIDNGYSGTNFERPAVQELLELVRDGSISMILVKDFSRFGRNSIETGYFIERVFPVFHTRFISVGDDFDSANYIGDTGGINVAIKYLMHEYYSRDLSTKVKSAMKSRFQSGEYQTKNCPYGYQKGSSGRLEPNEETAPVVRLIFSMAVSGMSGAAIARELNELDIPTPSEYKARMGEGSHKFTRTNGTWPNCTVLSILNDERYIGTYIYGKRTVNEIGGKTYRLKDESEWYRIPGHHPPIVAKDVFDKAQTAIRRFTIPNRKKREYPLRGKVVCGLCGHALTLHHASYYICRHSHSKASSPCHDQRIGYSELQEIVFEIISKQIDALLGVDVRESGKELDAQVANKAIYEEKISEVQEKKQKLYERLLLDEIDDAAFKIQNNIYNASLVEIKNTCAILSAQAQAAKSEYDCIVKQRNVVRGVAGETSLTQALADALVDKVVVYPDMRVEVACKYNDGFGG